MDKIIKENSKWVHAVGNRWDTGCNETFCGITNLKKRKYLVVATDWNSERVTCPHCMESPAYRERMAAQMATRMTETKFEKDAREYDAWNETQRRGSRTGGMGPL